MHIKKHFTKNEYFENLSQNTKNQNVTIAMNENRSSKIKIVRQKI